LVAVLKMRFYVARAGITIRAPIEDQEGLWSEDGTAIVATQAEGPCCRPA